MLFPANILASIENGFKWNLAGQAEPRFSALHVRGKSAGWWWICVFICRSVESCSVKFLIPVCAFTGFPLTWKVIRIGLVRESQRKFYISILVFSAVALWLLHFSTKFGCCLFWANPSCCVKMSQNNLWMWLGTVAENFHIQSVKSLGI